MKLFLNKLIKIEKALEKKNKSTSRIVNPKYELGPFTWDSNIYTETMPDENFIRFVNNTMVKNNHIINPPIKTSKLTYIDLPSNKTMILDAMMHQGSKPAYQYKNKFLYSEHSGVITLENGFVDKIIISTNNNRIDPSDETIFLPTNSNLLAEHPYIFHTHPNTNTYAGRLSEGIIYEFPSANDIYNFIKYYNEGLALSSIIIAPEGAYNIRPISATNNLILNANLFYYLRKFINKLELSAIKSLLKSKKNLDLTNPDIFHRYVSSNYRYINLYNKLIAPANIFIEYYPRVKINSEWVIPNIHLQYYHKVH